MKYKGQVGEFKWWGFAISIAVCISIALGIYFEFSFIAEPPKDDLKAIVETALKAAKQSDSEARLLNQRLISLEERVERFEKNAQKKCK